MGADFRILFEKIAEDSDSAELLRLADELQSEVEELRELIKLSSMIEEDQTNFFTTT